MVTNRKEHSEKTPVKQGSGANAPEANHKDPMLREGKEKRPAPAATAEKSY